MKEAVFSKNRKSAKSRNRHNLEVDAEAVKELRTVKDHEAFYFYEAVGKPTGETAKNLSDFLDKVKIVKSESLMFHVQRRDFQNWVGGTIGDSKLAEKLGRISPSNDDNVRMSIYKTVENHIKELRESSIAISIEDSRTVVPVRV